MKGKNAKVWELASTEKCSPYFGANVPLCGILSGQERVTEVKKTSMGYDLTTEKYENIVEKVAQWHAR